MCYEKITPTVRFPGMFASAISPRIGKILINMSLARGTQFAAKGAGDIMRTADDLFEAIDRLGEQIAVQMESLDASRRELDKVIESHPARDVLRRISATLDGTTAGLRELCQALWFRTAGLRRLIGGRAKTT